MPYLLNFAYLLALLVLSPWLLYKAATTDKYRRGLWDKFLGLTKFASLSPCHLVTLSPCHPTAWFHGVSVGEIHLLRQLVACFRRRHPDWQCVVSTTTDTGFQEACKHFPDLHVCYWPFDFSWSVRRALREVNPNLVVLAEGELWPNFLMAAKEQEIPVAVVNGRMSPRSGRRYQCFGALVRRLWRHVDLFAVQTEEYAAAFRALGAWPERVQVTGSVKYDGVTGDRRNPRTEELRRLLAVKSGDLVWVAGSTQSPEEEIVLDIFRKLRTELPNLRLFLVPRQKDRFEEVAQLLQRSGLPFLRRSQIIQTAGTTSGVTLSPCHLVTLSPCHPVILIDTIGELGALWGLADVAFVGGSLDGRRGGQNMIEPAAYGAAVVFGPHVWNFQDTATRLVEAGGAIQVADATALEAIVRRLLSDATERQRLGTAAQRFVQEQQGATERTVHLLDQLLTAASGPAQAA